MIASYRKCAFIFTALLALIILLIRAQPPTGEVLRAMLDQPEQCTAPCFIGIRPGQTTLTQAMHILENHAWVASVRDDTSLANDLHAYGMTGEITWRWSGIQPDWLNERAAGRMWVSGGVVQSVYIDTRLLLGDVRVMLGKPDREWIQHGMGRGGRTTISYNAIYTLTGSVFLMGQFCPVRNLWRTRVTIRLLDEAGLHGQIHTVCYER